MKQAFELLRVERRARVFYATLAQSALGTGAAYVALLLVAYDRSASAWAISAVLVADLVAPMLLGPVFGAVVDRWSRRACMIVADLIRVVAFAGVAVVDGIEVTVALALLAGVGTAIYTPASLAALPSLVAEHRIPPAMSLYGAIGDFGLAAGPALAALGLLIGGPELLLILNAATFAISAVALGLIDFGRAPAREHTTAGSAVRAVFVEALEGLRELRGRLGLRTVLMASATGLFFGGLINVAELPFITEDLDADDVFFSIAVSAAGLGIVLGALSGSSGGHLGVLRVRFLAGLAVMGTGYLLTGLAPAVGVVMITFAVAGYGNGMMLVYERLIIQATVSDALTGRAFGTKDALSAWSFALSFLVAGAAVSELGARAVLLIAGAGVIAVVPLAALGLRSMRAEEPPLEGPAETQPSSAEG